MPVRRDISRQMTVLPGGGSLTRLRWPQGMQAVAGGFAMKVADPTVNVDVRMQGV